MQLALPWYFYILFGIFLGGLIFNAKFRHEFDSLLARFTGGKKKSIGQKPTQTVNQPIKNDGGCVICGRNNAQKAIEFDNNRWICRDCDTEIEGSHRLPKRKGTHIRDIYLGDE